MMPKSSEIEGLTKAMRAALFTASDSSDGVAGSAWYRPDWLGGRATVKALNKRGLLEPNKTVGAGLLWRITDAGRAALSARPRP